MFSNSAVESYSRFTAEINRKYCRRNGYAFVHEQYDHVSLSPSHEKIRLLQRHLDSATYLLWVDSDACVIDHSVRLESFCEGQKDLIIAGHEYGFDPSGRRLPYRMGDIPCGLNAGILMIRNGSWSRRFLDDWWNRCTQNHLSTRFYEQGELQRMLVENTSDMQSHIHIITPCSRLNRCDDNGTDICEFILHLWGAGSEYRESVFSEIAAGRKPNIPVQMPHFALSPDSVPNIFIDGGTNLGQGLEFFRKNRIIDDSFTVHAFEPNPACTLDELIKSSSAIHLHRDAVWTMDGTVPFIQEEYSNGSTNEEAIVRSDGQASSIHGIGFDPPGHGKTLAVRSIDFSRFLMSLPINANIICKLDIEGSEFAVLRHLIRTGSINRIRELYCEFHERFMPNESEQSKNDLIRDVESSGTKVHTWY
jgi:FkbM family methyltransferase